MFSLVDSNALNALSVFNVKISFNTRVILLIQSNKNPRDFSHRHLPPSHFLTHVQQPYLKNNSNLKTKCLTRLVCRKQRW